MMLGLEFPSDFSVEAPFPDFFSDSSEHHNPLRQELPPVVHTAFTLNTKPKSNVSNGKTIWKTKYVTFLVWAHNLSPNIRV